MIKINVFNNDHQIGFEIKAMDDFEKGSEVFYSYG